MRTRPAMAEGTDRWRLDDADPEVGRRSVRRRQIRLRRGPVSAAWSRLRAAARGRTPLECAMDLVSVRPLDPPTVELVAGTVSRFVADEHRIELAADSSAYDLAFAYAHELGHLFDCTNLDDAHRAAFGDAVGTGHDWCGGRYHEDVGEAWASAFAAVVCCGPWRCTLWAPGNWPEERTPHVLATCCEIVRATVEACTDVGGTSPRRSGGVRFAS